MPPRLSSTGVSNFGRSAADYLGSGLLQMLGGVSAPAYDHLTEYVLVACSMKALPLFLIPLLVPHGSPRDTAKEIATTVPRNQGKVYLNSDSLLINVLGEKNLADDETKKGRGGWR